MDVPYIINMEDVYVRYPAGHGGLKTVLNDIDLHVRTGEFVTIIGPSGCGKSTLLKLILGSERPTSGTVLVNGVNFDGVNRDRGIVFQQYSLVPHLTVIKNIILGLELERFGFLRKPVEHLFRLKTYRAFKAKAEEYLARIEFSPADGKKFIRQLSGGMQQRVAIAQALITHPKVLLMDEPFSALDALTRQKMQQFILEQWKRKRDTAEPMTVVFVTHELREALFLGTRVIALSQFYKSDNGFAPGSQGSKIISDFAVHATSSIDDKFSPELNAIEAQLIKDLDSASQKHIGDFDLKHPDSFRTVNSDEWKR